MKIAFPVNGKSIEADICDSFGSAPNFVIYHTISKEIEYLDHRAVVAQGAGESGRLRNWLIKELE